MRIVQIVGIFFIIFSTINGKGIFEKDNELLQRLKKTVNKSINSQQSTSKSDKHNLNIEFIHHHHLYTDLDQKIVEDCL